MSRLATAQTTSTFATSPAHCWGESFVYDSLPNGPGPWGNLTNINVVSTNYNGCTQENLSIGVSGKNQVTSSSGYVYDLAGNLTAISGASYGYNAENEMTTAAGVTYTYDGDGKRVKKSNGKLYWYGGSEVLDETDLSGNLTSEYVFFGMQRIAKRDTSNNVDYYFSDHLGSSRVVANPTGTVLDDSDFYPFGHERSVTGPTSGNNYKFTGKERDVESGLDYMGARYYGNALGRFATPDPKGIALRHLLKPQKLNKYSYVINNPMSFFDPNGMEEVTIVYRTFIPASSVTLMGKTNGGDNRGFSTAPNASSRTSISIRIETDPNIRPGNPIISVDGKVGNNTGHADPSTTIKNGQVVDTVTATKGLPTATGTRDANGTPIISIQQDTINPLSPGPSALTPGISANLNVMVYQDASTTQVNGTAAQFPVSELNVTRADGTTTPVTQYMPPADATPWSLAKPDRDVNEKKETPACNGGDKGCPK